MARNRVEAQLEKKHPNLQKEPKFSTQMESNQIQTVQNTH